jgi:crotonobetainyl-CoA:carnitine CoA-transferase CaiB-like acyl-CoA transferase
MSVTPPQAKTHPPLLGEHTEDLLSKVLGYSADQIASLRERGIV